MTTPAGPPPFQVPRWVQLVGLPLLVFFAWVLAQSVGHTIFLAGLLFGREIGWIGQTRDDHAVPFMLALRNLWPHTLLGCAALALLAITQPLAILYALFLAAGPALAVPFAMITAWPPFGDFAARIGIGRLPEETARSAVLVALALPAIEMAAPLPRPSSV